jgi:hypothetical protein
MSYNCVYYFSPDHGRYIKASIVPAYLGGTATTLQELKQECLRAGYYAVLGNSKIGPPDDAPR